MMDAKKALLLPRMTALDHSESEKLEWSPLYHLAQLAKNLGFSQTTLDSSEDFEVVLSRYLGDDLYKSPYRILQEEGLFLEFDWSALKGRWMMTRATYKGSTTSRELLSNNVVIGNVGGLLGDGWPDSWPETVVSLLAGFDGSDFKTPSPDSESVTEMRNLFESALGIRLNVDEFNRATEWLESEAQRL